VSRSSGSGWHVHTTYFAQADGALVAGKTTTIDLDTSRHTRYLAITTKLTFTISVAVITAIRNLGSPFAIFDRLRISESGVDTGVGDPRLFGYASDWLKRLARESCPSDIDRDRRVQPDRAHHHPV